MSKLILEKDSLLKLQTKGILNNQLVESVWNELSQECPEYKIESQNSTENTHVDYVTIPPLQKRFRQTIEPIDISIAFSFANGSHLARRMKSRLEEDHYKVSFVNDNDTSILDIIQAEKRVANSRALVVLLTADCLKQVEVAFAMSVAQYYYKHASLVHDASSCFFPGYEEHPPSLRSLFSEKAITFLPCFQLDGILQVIEKYESEKRILENVLQTETSIAISIYNKLSRAREVTLSTLREKLISSRTMELTTEVLPESEIQEIDELLKEIDIDHNAMIERSEFCNAYLYNEKFEKRMMKLRQTVLPSDHGTQVTEDIHTRLFLSHKRSTGQGIAGRLYEGLKKDYAVFLDSEAKFKIHNLKQIVENTDVFIFILSPGIFQSPWCLQELQSAVESKKKIVVIRDLHYTLPDELPEQWKPLDSIFRQNPLIWMAEYNLQCISALKSEIGPSDSMIDHIVDVLSEHVTSIKNTGILKLTRNMLPGSFPALLWILNENAISNGHNGHLAASIRKASDKHLAILSSLSSCFLSDIKTIDVSDYKITDADVFKYTPSLTSYSQQLKDVDVILKKIKLSSPRNFREFFQYNFGHSIKNLTFLKAIPLVPAPLPDTTRAKATEPQRVIQGLLPPPPPTAAPAPPGAPPGLSAPPPPPGTKLSLSSHRQTAVQSEFVFKESALCVVNDAVVKAVSAFLGNVRKLIIEHSRLTDSGWTELVQSSTRLEQLEVLIADDLTDAGVRVTPDILPGLKSLVLPTQNNKITTDVLLEIVKKFKNLEMLQMIPVSKETSSVKLSEIWPKINSATLGWLGEHHNLTELDLNGCKIASELSKVLKNPKTLKILNLSGTDVRDVSMETVLGASNLVTLDVSHCQITASGISHIAKLSALKSLDLSGCQIGDDAVQKLSGLALEELFLAQCDTITNTALESISKNFSALKKLVLNGCSRISNPGLSAVAQSCHNLQHVELDSCFLISLQGIQPLTSKCNKISHLSLECCYLIGDAEIESIAKNLGANLTLLNIAFCKKIRNDSMKHLGAHCKNLQHLNITRCSEVTEVGFQYLAENLTHLKSLNLMRTYLTTDTSVSLIAKQCPNLSSIDLTYCRSIRGDFVKDLGACRELTSLNLSEDTKVQGLGFEGLQNCSKLKCLKLARVHLGDKAIELIGVHPTLTELDLTEVPVTDTGLKAMASLFPNLKKLSLIGNQIISTEGLAAVALGCPEIEELYLTSCVNITDDTVYHIAKNMKNLKTLHLPGQNLTEKGLEHVGNYCYSLTGFRIAECEFLNPIARFAENLTALTFYKCLQLSDFELINIAPKTGNLTILRLAECEQVTDKGIVALEKYCHKLQIVNLFNCKAITDKSLISLAKHNTGITQIQLKGCKRVTHKGIQAVVEKNKLEFLDLEECSKIADHCLDIIAKKCHSLKTLRLVKCSEISDRGVKSIANGCKKLEALSFELNEVSNESADYISANLLRLKYLSFSQCVQVSDQTLEYLGTRCPGLQRLVLDDTAVTDVGVQKFAEKGICDGLRYLSLDDCLKLTPQCRNSKYVVGLTDVSEFQGQFRPLI